jgi:hypothetical protein
MNVVFAHLVPEQLRPVSEPVLSKRLFRVLLADKFEVSISAFTIDQAQARDQFEFFIVKPQHHAQKQHIELRQKGTSVRLGYLFPIAALAPDSAFDNEWAGVFAHAAVDWVLSTENAKEVLTISQIDDITPEKRRSVVDCFEPALGVVVLSKDGLKKAGCDVHALRLMIQEHGIRPISARDTQSNSDAEFEFEPRLSLRECSFHVIDELNQFCFLLEVANRQNYLPARLLILYQVVEALISRVFEQAARDLVSDSAMLQNIWDLRDALDELSREKSRINLLFSEYIDDKSNEVHSATLELKNACVAFLRKTEPIVTLTPATAPATDPVAQGPVPAPPQVEAPPAADAADEQPEALVTRPADTEVPPVVEHPPTPAVPVAAPPAVDVADTPGSAALAQAGVKQDLAERHWSDLLYRTRNLLVHRQWQMKNIPEKELSDVCAALEQLLYLAVGGFRAKPKRTSSRALPK